MKATVTLDYYDGSRNRQKEVDLEELRMSDLVMLLTEKGAAGITITKTKDLQKMVQEMGEDQ